MSQAYICHYSEIGLKGKNRHFFEKRLMQNIRKALKRVFPDERMQILNLSKRIVITFERELDDTLASSALKNVFGLVNFGAARIIPSKIEEMEHTCLDLFKNKQFETFAIRAKRADKNFPLISTEINSRLGSKVVEQFSKKVNLSNPDVTCHVEVDNEQTYIFIDKKKGVGGLPVEVSGKVLVLLSGGFDSPVAAYYAMKRGAYCEFIHFHSYPYTQKASQDKVKDLAGVLNKYQFKSRLYMAPFAETQKDIVFKCPDKYRIIMYRRFMMRIAERLCLQKGIKAIVTGESLGQVASQTLENIGVVEETITLPVLRPLIGMDKSEIIDMARVIGTHDISKLPHDDVCTRFMPRHPVIRAELTKVKEAEKELDIEALVERDLQEIEVVDIG